MRKYLALCLSGLALGWAFAACAAPTPTAPPSPTAAGNAALTKTKDGLTVSLVLQPQPLRVGAPTQMTVMLTDANDQPVSDASIKLSLAMVGMTMEKNEPTVESKGSGAYTASGTFPMGGNTWSVDLQITRGDKTTEVLFTNLDVKE